jgi:putative serine protease PepD
MDDNSTLYDNQYEATNGPITGAPVASPLPGSDFSSANAANSANKGSHNKRAGRLPSLLLAAALATGMFLGGAGTGAAVLALGNNSATTTAAVTSGATTQTVAQVEANSISNIYKQVSASVVMIDSTIQGTGRFSASGEATGSGIVLDTNGDILTNNHVIAGATSIQVVFTDGNKYTATVLGATSANDLAVIKVSAPSSELSPATLGDSSTVQPGEEVITIGYPYAMDQSVSAGIVSGLNRSTDADSSTGYSQESESLSGLIQVDAAINPGNSGGALVDSNGDVIGVNTMIESPVEGFTGIGLAIPINQAKSLIPQLEQGGGTQQSSTQSQNGQTYRGSGSTY